MKLDGGLTKENQWSPAEHGCCSQLRSLGVQTNETLGYIYC